MMSTLTLHKEKRLWTSRCRSLLSLPIVIGWLLIVGMGTVWAKETEQEINETIHLNDYFIMMLPKAIAYLAMTGIDLGKMEQKEIGQALLNEAPGSLWDYCAFFNSLKQSYRQVANPADSESIVQTINTLLDSSISYKITFQKIITEECCHYTEHFSDKTVTVQAKYLADDNMIISLETDDKDCCQFKYDAYGKNSGVSFNNSTLNSEKQLQHFDNTNIIKSPYDPLVRSARGYYMISRSLVLWGLISALMNFSFDVNAFSYFAVGTITARCLEIYEGIITTYNRYFINVVKTIVNSLP